MVRLSFQVLILLAAAGMAFGQAKPNFSGEWKMNNERSDYGKFPKPDKMVRKIVHEEPHLRIQSTQSGPRGEITSELKLVTDGTEQIIRLGNIEAKTTTRWDGNNLRVDTKRPFQAAEISMQEKWTLSDDGKTLTIATRTVTPKGEVEIVAVLEKQ